MMKTFNIDNNRILNLVENNDEIHILDKTTMKAAVFTPARWASFMLCLGEIHDQVCKLIEGAHVAYLNHYGGGWHVTVSRGFTVLTSESSTCRSGRRTASPPAWE